MAMTEEERRAARNEASRRWYLAHKAAKAQNGDVPKKRGRPAKQKPAVEAVTADTPKKRGRPAAPKAEAMNPVGKKNEVRPAKTDTAEKALFTLKKDPNARLEKDIAKMIKKNAGAIEQLKAVTVGVAEMLETLAKHEDQKFAKKMTKMLVKGLSLSVTNVKNGKDQVAFNLGAKKFSVPKTDVVTETKAAQPEPQVTDAERELDAEIEKTLGAESVIEEPAVPEDPEKMEVPVDPERFDELEAGDQSAVMSDEVSDGEEPDEFEDDDDEPSWKNKDPDDMTDEEREEYEEAMAEEEREADFEGRADMMNEMMAQGVDFGD